jgi:hypothetical protein
MIKGGVSKGWREYEGGAEGWREYEGGLETRR